MRDFVRWAVLVCLILLPVMASGQSGVGLPFLKIGVGARQAGLGGVFTGVGDDIYTVNWNPGGLSHIRRWQWSAAYNRWFTDIHQASLSYVRQFRVLGSRKTSVGFSFTYLGMPSWDATGGKAEAVSAGHSLAVLSLGQRLDWIHPSLAVGVNAKWLSSTFDTYSARGIFGDVGLLFRPERFRVGLGLFDYGVFTAGAALLHLGPQVQFDVEKTALPMTWRVGASIKMGRYHGLSLLIASDLIGVKDRDPIVGVGSELWWRDILGVRAGYRANGNDLGDLSVGFGLRWDDVMNSLLGLPTRFGDAFEINVADVSYGDVLQETYRGTLSHYPIAPEPFNLGEANVVGSQVLGASSAVTLTWEKSPDPDPFDEVSYLVMVDKDKDRVNDALRRAERNMAGFWSSGAKDSLFVCDTSSDLSYVASLSEGGIYYWAVAAFDLGNHVQLAKRGAEHVGEFVVTTYDLTVGEIVFTPTQWITTTPEQGTLTVNVANPGVAATRNFRLIVSDSALTSPDPTGSPWIPLLDTYVSRLNAGSDTTIQVAWQTPFMGEHAIRVSVEPEADFLEIRKDNNIRQRIFVSVPKGTLVAPDSVQIMATGYDSTEIPIVPEIYFEANDSQVNPVYYTEDGAFPSLLITLSDRLKANPSIQLHLFGAIDALSNEKDPALADQRAENVRQELLDLGVPRSQLDVVSNHPLKVLGQGRRPPDPQDAEWAAQQNRVVTFSVDRPDEYTIFGPHRVAVDTTVRNGVGFAVNVHSPGGIETWRVNGESSDIHVQTDELVNGQELRGDISWHATNSSGRPLPRDRWHDYALVLTDQLDRTFRTRPDSIYLDEVITVRRREIFGSAKFNQTEPVYQFYWDRLMDLADELAENPNMRVRFEGHACAIGSDAVNERLSLQRARRFSNAFRDRIRAVYPDQYQSILRRVSEPAGFGEKEPLTVKLKGRSELLLGDNSSPIGRYYNRRIMVLLFKEN